MSILVVYSGKLVFRLKTHNHFNGSNLLIRIVRQTQNECNDKLYTIQTSGNLLLIPLEN
jgi:hypothetical protein